MIRLAEEKDYMQLAYMKWEHSREDDEVYGEKNLEGVDQNRFIEEFVGFLKTDSTYTVFVYEQEGEIASAMFVHLFPKVPRPNGREKTLAYLTNVHTLKKYRNKGIGTELLQFILRYLKEKECELVIVYPSELSVKWYERNGIQNENEAYECQLMAEEP